MILISQVTTASLHGIPIDLDIQLGPSALAGFLLFLFIAPLQERMLAHRVRIRRESMKFTDKRAKVLLELLGKYPEFHPCRGL